MKGITPVIAIILLLLMAVAAAGGFYFVYQQFSQSGEESGSSQIDALGEQALSQIKIESIAAGKVYVRNVGASEIDATKLSVYVDNIPYPVNLSTSSIAENARATLKFTTVPTCSSAKCEVRVSGAAAASQSVEAQKLSCASDSDCAYGESCSSGICVFTTSAPVTCGDGTCDEGEYGYTCFEDCAPESILLFSRNATDGNIFIPEYTWNGTTYVWESNLTTSGQRSWEWPTMRFREDGTATAVSTFDWNNIITQNRDLWRSDYDGSSWSTPHNLSNSPSYKKFSQTGFDIDSSGNGMVAWADYYSGHYPAWVSLTPSSNSDPQYMTGENGFNPEVLFSFAPNDEGYLFFSNYTNHGGSWDFNGEVKYKRWDGSSWDPSYTNLQINNGLETYVLGMDFDSAGNGIVAWAAFNETNHARLKYATYDGSTWTTRGNFEDYVPENDTSWVAQILFYDQNDVPLLVYIKIYDNSNPYTEYRRYVNSAWSSPQNITDAFRTQGLPIRYHDGTIFMPYMDFYNSYALGRPFYNLTVWDGNAWSEPVSMGEYNG